MSSEGDRLLLPLESDTTWPEEEMESEAIELTKSEVGFAYCDFSLEGRVNPGIVEIDLSMLEGLLGSATVIGDFKGRSGRVAPSSAKKDVSNAK